MLHTKIVDSKEKKLSINDAERFISSVEFGASIFFTGTVRNLNNNKSVVGITYDSHNELVIKSFEEIYKDADKKVTGEFKLTVPKMIFESPNFKIQNGTIVGDVQVSAEGF